MKLYTGDYFKKGSNRTIRFLEEPSPKHYQHFVRVDGTTWLNGKEPHHLYIHQNNCVYKLFCEDLLRLLKQNHES
ncbi:MAG: hypothetical protein WC679_02410 [Bacteroidales bacterium]|jgi:hypothetical protein